MYKTMFAGTYSKFEGRRFFTLMLLGFSFLPDSSIFTFRYFDKLSFKLQRSETASSINHLTTYTNITIITSNHQPGNLNSGTSATGTTGLHVSPISNNSECKVIINSLQPRLTEDADRTTARSTRTTTLRTQHMCLD